MAQICLYERTQVQQQQQEEEERLWTTVAHVQPPCHAMLVS
jgi:hypothetical protein